MALHFHCTRRDDQVVLQVSTRALDRAHAATDPQQYLRIGAGGAASLMQWSTDDEPIRAPQISVYDGQLSFTDSRHRARAALLQGRKVIPVIVHRDNVADVRALLAQFR